MRAISIDIGLKGGVAFWEKESDWKLLTVCKMPTIIEIYKEKKRRRYDIPRLLEYLWEFIPNVICYEHLWTFHRHTPQTNFGVGNGYGTIKTLAVTYQWFFRETVNVAVVEIAPLKWKKEAGLERTEKHEAVKMVNEKYGLNLPKTHDGLADAVLIGEVVLREY